MQIMSKDQAEWLHIGIAIIVMACVCYVGFFLGYADAKRTTALLCERTGKWKLVGQNGADDRTFRCEEIKYDSSSPTLMLRTRH